MKTKIKLDIHRYSVLLPSIAMLVAEHNGGSIEITISDIIGLFKWKKIELPTLCKDMYYLTPDDNTLYLAECPNEKAADIPLLNITWEEHFELTDCPNEQ